MIKPAMSEATIQGTIDQKLRSLSPDQRRSLERLLAEKRRAAPIPSIPRDGPLPLSFAQNRLWFLEQLEGHTGAYNVPMAWRLRGALDVDALHRSLGDLVRRHELLRTRYPVDADGAPRAVIHPFRPTALELVDLSDQADREAQLAQRVRSERTTRFALATHDPIRWSIVRMGHEDHVLILALHHIAVDGWALGVLTRELWATYQAFSRGRPSPLAEPQVQYADVAAWQRAQLTAERLTTLETHWSRAIHGAAPVVDLAADRPRPAQQSFKGRVHRFELDGALVERLKLLARSTGATPFMVLMAAWSAMIARRTGQPDFLVGTPIANRTTREAEQLIGCFINTLPLRARPAAHKTFRQHLSELRETALAAYEHQDFPFEQLVERLSPGRSLSHAPLFQTMLIVQNAPPPVFEAPGLVFEHVDRPEGVAMFDLTLTLTEWDGKGMQGQLEYASDLFEPSTVGRIAEHFETLLRAALERPDAMIGELPLMTAGERRLVVDGWNATRREVDLDRPAIVRFLEQAAAAPGARAVIDGARSWTYAELELRSRALAGALLSEGVRPGDRVGVHLERSADVIASMLAVWRVGAAYVPLDPAFPAARLAHQCDGLGVVMTAREIECELPAAPRRLLVALVTDAPERLPAAALAPDDLAYVLYTSGSTGVPKGVAIPQRALTNFLASMAEAPGLGAHDRLLAVTTISFDIAGLELFLPLTVGAAVILASRAEAQDARALMRLIETSAPTVMQATPTTWRSLFEAGWRGRPSLRVLVGGEALPGDLCDRLVERSAEVWNLYGPTETTIWSTAAPMLPGRPAGPPTIGRPIANTTTYVVDAQHRPQPIGVPGELMIGGLGVAHGYLGQPALTAQRFVPSPFVAGDRLYATGDQARWRSDGTLEFLGRNDHQVKVRGFRIELGEVEAVLSTHPEVARAAVHTHADASGQPTLVAYVVPSGERAAVDGLRAHLRAKLPEYMIPSAFVELTELPLTLNGKVDRARLPAPVLAVAPTAEPAQPQDGLERTLVKLFADVLGVAAVSTDQSFFELGGHSLLAVRLLDRIERATGTDVTLMELFRAPSVRELADVLRGNTRAPEPASLEPLKPDGSRTPIFFIGSTPFARRLVPHLGHDQPVYGLNLFGLFQEERAPQKLDLDRIADLHIAEIRAAQPQGPYQLLAYCADAVLAFVVAQRLTAAGQEVRFLGFIDAIWGLRRVQLKNLLGNVDEFGRDYLRLKVQRRAQYYQRKVVRARERLGARARAWLGQPIPLRELHAEVIAAYYRAVSTYDAQPFPGRITLFTSREERNHEPHRIRELAGGGIERREVPGYHDAMFDSPNVETLGALIRAELEE